MSSLAVLFLAGTARAERPTGVIPSLNATVTSLRFFESPQGAVVPRNQRVYASQFSRSQVRRIFFELNLTHPAPGRRVAFTVVSLWHSPGDGGRPLRRTLNAALESGWSWSYWHDGA